MNKPLAILPLVAFVALAAFSGPAVADCRAEAEKLARELGGEVRRVVAGETQGRPTCDISVAVPGEAGQPPRIVNRKVDAN